MEQPEPQLPSLQSHQEELATIYHLQPRQLPVWVLTAKMMFYDCAKEASGHHPCTHYNLQRLQTLLYNPEPITIKPAMRTAGIE